ncbi:hypothetical protein ACE6H2_002783 [Prunus campanulata]
MAHQMLGHFFSKNELLGYTQDMHFGTSPFRFVGKCVYKGRKLCFADNCVDDYLSLLDLKKIGAELGYKVGITQKVTSLKVLYKVHAKDVVKEVLDDRCIANLVGIIPSNRVWPSLDSEEYANVAEEDVGRINGNEEEHVQVESNGNKANNEEEHVQVEFDGNEAENEEKEKDEELKDNDYEYTDDEMPNIDPRMTGKMGANVPPNVGEEEPNIDPEMVPPNEGTWAILDDGAS